MPEPRRRLAKAPGITIILISYGRLSRLMIFSNAARLSIIKISFLSIMIMNSLNKIINYAAEMQTPSIILNKPHRHAVIGPVGIMVHGGLV